MPNTNGSFTQVAASGATTLTKPANAVGFVLQAFDTNSDVVRWAIGTTAATGTGSQLEAGRDTGYQPCGANVSVCPVTGTQTVGIQWVLSS